MKLHFPVPLTGDLGIFVTPRLRIIERCVHLQIETGPK